MKKALAFRSLFEAKMGTESFSQWILTRESSSVRIFGSIGFANWDIDRRTFSDDLEDYSKALRSYIYIHGITVKNRKTGIHKRFHGQLERLSIHKK